jgi:hypothetical protein
LTSLACPYSSVVVKTDAGVTGSIAIQTVPVDIGAYGSVNYIVTDLL